MSEPPVTRSRPSVVGVVLAALVLLAAGLAGNSRGEALAQEERAGCYPRDGVGVIEGDRARVFRVPSLFRRGYRIRGCAFETGEPRFIDDDDQNWAFVPPAMHLRGTIIGLADQFCEFSCFSSVLVRDLAKSHRQGTLRTVRAGPRRYSLVKVGSLRAQPNGAVAWIACRDRTHEARVEGRRGPNCIREQDRRRGDRNYVMRVLSGERRPRIIDWGRIEPGSMRLAGTRISWVKIIRGRPVLRRATLR